MNKPAISVIIPKRNTREYFRDPKRLNDVLYSLKNQTIRDKIEIIVSDIDSDPEFQKQHKATCKKYGAKYIYTETCKLWNISRARNIGIRNASGEYVMVTDVDIIFSPNFIETVLNYANPKTIVHCRLSDLPRDYTGKLDNFSQMLKDRTILRPRHCYGGCQVVIREWANKVHGYDEEYETWGADDTDFYYRAFQDGKKSIWIEGDTVYFHQWHSQANRSENSLRLSKNRQRCKQTEMGKLPLIRNPFGWGGEAVASEHPDTAVIITTFLRDENLFECVKSIRKYYPGMAIFVADGGNGNTIKTEFLQKHNCTHFLLPFDTGVCGSRNEALKKIPKKYTHIVICEDDISFTPESQIGTWRKILDHDKSLGIIGGLMWRVQSQKTAIQHYEGTLSVKDDTVYVRQTREPKWITIDSNTRYCYDDIILNVFLMRREVHDDMKWDANIPQAPEHLDFFLSLKRWTNWKVGYTDNFQMNHVQLGYEGDYLLYRQRNQGFRHFCKKHKIRHVYSDWHRQFTTYPDKVDYMEWEMKQGSVMVDNLVKTIGVLDKLKAKWWLANGTCLGAVRDKDFTRMADNIDIALAPKQAKLWDDFVSEFKKVGFKLHREWKHKSKKCVLTFKKFKMKVNIFFLYEKNGHIWHGYFTPADKEFIPYIFPKKTFSKIKEARFKRLKCYIPDPPESYLEALYGQAWKIPDYKYKSWKDCKAIDRSFLKKDKTVFVPGTWDLLHVGHLSILEKAKELGTKVIVGVYTDKAIKASLVPFKQRKRMVESLRVVDKVMGLTDKDPTSDLKQLKLKPDYLMCANNKAVIPGGEYIKDNYGKIVRVSLSEEVNISQVKKRNHFPKSTKASRKGGEAIAVGIKTFLRERTLFRTLEALEKHMPPPYRLYIADDGSISDMKAHKYQELEAEGHKIFRLPFNSGLSHGRNTIVKEVKEKHFLLLDDDIVLDNSETIEKMKAVLDSREDLGVVSGILYREDGLPNEENRNYLSSENYQKGLKFEFSRGMLFRVPSVKKYHRTGNGLSYVEADQVVNFFMAKTEIFKQATWDERIKIEWEHIDFFLALQKAGWKAAVCLDTKAVHARPEISNDYEQYRRGAPAHYFLQKNGLSGVINRF